MGEYKPARYPDKINDLVNADGSLNIIESHGKKFGGKVIVEVYDGKEDLFGKKAEDLQDVELVDGCIVGTLNYVKDYTGFSSKPEEQHGHYIAVRVLSCVEGDCYCQMGNGKEVKLDSDGIIVFITHERNVPIIGRVKKGGKLIADYKVDVKCEFAPEE